MISIETYWDSPKAKKLFLGSSTDIRSVVDLLQQRIERLQRAKRTSDGWRDLINKHDVDNLCSPYDIFITRQGYSILCLAYVVAVGGDELCWWVEDCCSQALYKSIRMGIEAAVTNKCTIADWNILLRANRELFPLPEPKIHKQKTAPWPQRVLSWRNKLTVHWSLYW